TQGATPAASPVASPLTSGDLPTVQIAQLTGEAPGINDTFERWRVFGTDLGSSFMYGDEMYIVFGDTFGPANTLWRSNVIAVTTDDDPSDGIVFDRMIEDTSGMAKELLNAENGAVTTIPTYGVAVGDRLFMHYMSVTHWGAPGHWDLDESGLAWSDDAGESWTRDGQVTWPADSNFGQVAIEEYEGHLYFFGIPGGRYGGMQLARVVPEQVLEQAAYEYWDGAAWGTDITAAATLIEAPVGELSVRWNSYYGTWLLMTLADPLEEIQVWTADALTGPWEGPRVAARGIDYPSLYAPYMFPKWNDDPEIYFTMSLFGPYQVYLLQTSIPDLDPAL
ncbi:MAG: DUF4185 domain-containing protein, partial [Thermomicrobiales bacterium]